MVELVDPEFAATGLPPYDLPMPLAFVETLGRGSSNAISTFGQFCQFSAMTFRSLFTGGFRWKSLRQLLPQLYEVGVKTVPVVGIVGAFIGMVMAVETYSQFKAIGQEDRMGSVIALSVVKQIGPVLAAVMIAGRVGGALTAELGTMNVTEQLDALRVMGSDPISYLVVPRFLACVLLAPILTLYSDVLGIAGGWFISVMTFGVPNEAYWHFSRVGVEHWQVFEGIFKSFFFGGAIGLIACFKGFTCGSGASGVGRACTDSFVESFIAIIALNFFFAQMAHEWYVVLYGSRSMFG